MNVIIATGKQEIDLMIQKVTGGGLSPVAYREGVLLQFQRYGAELAFLSPLLPGDIPFEQLLYELRKHGVRVIALVGHTSPKEIKEKWLPLSVYDLILDPVTEEKILLAIDSPATLGMAEEKISLLEKGETEEPEVNGWSKWFKIREQQNKVVEEKKTLQVETKCEPVVETNDRPSALQWLFRKRQSTAKENNVGLIKETDIIVNKTEQQEYKPILEKTAESPTRAKQSASIEATQTIPDWVSVKQEPIFFAQKTPFVQTDSQDPVENGANERKEVDLQINKRKDDSLYIRTPSQEWLTVLGFSDHKLPEPEGYNILVTSPSATGKTYVALNLAATLSKEGALTKLVSFRGETALWTYLDLPTGKRGPVQEYPNLYVETFENMATDGHYRVIDLPFDGWDKVLHWDNVLVVYVEDMDIHHKKLCEKYRDFWQGKRLLRVLNRFVPNVLETGQEQRLRINADLVLNDQPVNLVAMRYGRPVIHIDQSARREFEYAVKNILEAIPRTTENVRSIG